MAFENNYAAPQAEESCEAEAPQGSEGQPSDAGASAPTDLKAENFRRLAQTRANEIIRKLKTLSNLSNRNAYHYTEAQVKVIFDGIEQQVAQAKQRFLKEDESGYIQL